MELIYVILADAAEANPNGKFSLLGGGIENIYAHAFPTVQPKLDLVMRLRPSASETEQDHEFRVELTGPNEYHAALGDIGRFKLVPVLGASGGATAINLVLNLQILLFPEPGTYHFHFYVDNQEIGTFPLNVEERSANEISSSSDQQNL
jgi:hypothetical protein